MASKHEIDLKIKMAEILNEMNESFVRIDKPFKEANRHIKKMEKEINKVYNNVVIVRESIEDAEKGIKNKCKKLKF